MDKLKEEKMKYKQVMIIVPDDGKPHFAKIELIHEGSYIEMLDESPSDSGEEIEAMKLVNDLAEWSLKYPRGRIYSATNQPKMDGELIALEERAKQLYQIFKGDKK